MKDDVLDAWPPSGVRAEQRTEIARLVETLASVYYRIDVDVDELRRDRYAATATGTELDRIGREVGVQRPVGEGDDAFRRRVMAGRARSTSETTWDDFAELVLNVLDADETDVELAVDYGDELGAVIVRVTTSVLDAAPFSQAEIIQFLEAALPMSRRVVVRLTDVATWGDADKGWGTQWGGDIN